MFLTWTDIEKSDLAYLFRYISCQNLVLNAFGSFVECPCCSEFAFVPALRSAAHCTFCDTWFDV